MAQPSQKIVMLQNPAELADAFAALRARLPEPLAKHLAPGIEAVLDATGQ